MRDAGILAPASKLRPTIVPRPAVAAEETAAEAEKPAKRAGSRYRPWAELLKRCFAIDVLACPRCGGRMRLVALVTEAASVRRFLRGLAMVMVDGTFALDEFLHALVELHPHAKAH